MKKLIATILNTCMLLSLCIPSIAVNIPTLPEIQGEIFYESTDIYPGSTEPVTVTLSSIEHEDGSITIYQYENNVLLEEHTTTPGCGVIESIVYNADGTSSTSVEYVGTQSRDSDIPTDLLDPRELGSMHLLTPTDVLYSIDCYVLSEYFEDKAFTFGKGTAKTLSEWTSVLLAAFLFRYNPAGLAGKILYSAGEYGILEPVTSTLYEVVFTYTIVCDYYNQEIHGTPTKPAGLGKESHLDGTYAIVDFGDGREVKTEGYTVRDWGSDRLGKAMMFEVFGFEDIPTSWSNVDLR